MSDALSYIRAAATTIGVPLHNKYGSGSITCIAVSGTWPQIQEVMATALKLNSQELIDAAIEGNFGDREGSEFLDRGAQFHANIDALTSFDFDSMGDQFVVYWKRISGGVA
jgi:hypothetical protein